MRHEVEQKFLLADARELLLQLESLGFQEKDIEEQRDRYFNHPSRDFAATDEALRVRSIGERNFATYKGAKHSRRSKTRQEIETPLGEGAKAAHDFASLLGALGFRAVAQVRKSQRAFAGRWEDHDCEVAIDAVEQLGAFAEVECIAESDDRVPTLEDSVLRLAKRLGLRDVEPRSYLELVLASRAP